MELKTYIWIGIIVGGIVGGLVGSLMDSNSLIGLWGIILSGVGSIIGIFLGYKMYNG